MTKSVVVPSLPRKGGRRTRDEAKRAARAPSSSSRVTSNGAAVVAAPSRSALLVMGTYHSVMAGLMLRKGAFSMKFSIKHHVGSIGAVSITDKYIASAGVDERVFLFTNKAEHRLSAAVKQKLRTMGEPLSVRLADLGSLTPPSEVTCLVFTANSQYLLGGCADGQLLAYRTRDWSLGVRLQVHERALVALAVHPTSHGSLVLTIGADRVVAALDMVQGRLLTKWRYTTHLSAAREEGEHGAVSREEGSREAPPCQKVPLSLRGARESPAALHFSPSGAVFCVHARFSFIVYATATMEPIHVFYSPSPQPSEELHCALFLDDQTLLFGNESAQLLRCVLPEAGEALELQPLAPAEQPARDADPRERHPLSHTCRVKTLARCGSTIFSADSNGVVIAWTVEQAEPPTLRFVCSTNCQGRITSMDVLSL